MTNTHICLYCKAEQVEPTNPLKWCELCGGKVQNLYKLTSWDAELKNKVSLLGRLACPLQINVVDKTENSPVSYIITDFKGYIYNSEEVKKIFDNALNFTNVNKKEISEHNINKACYQRKINKNKKAGYVYLLEKDSIYKIGFSMNVKNRANALKSKFVHSIVADDMSLCEFIFHSALYEQNIDGEWFNLTEEQINYIKTITEFKNGKFYFNGEN